MKWFVRSFVFAAALFLGISVASIMLYGGGLSNCVVKFPVDSGVMYDEPPVQAPRPTGISVMYARLERDTSDDQPYLKFVIHNGSDRRISYKAKIAESPYAELTANGRELPIIMGCGNGIKTFYILPGSSAEVHVQPRSYLERPRKSEPIVAGFYLTEDYTDKSETYTSEPLLLPREFREAIEPRSLSGM